MTPDKEISPEKFCAKWVPELTGISPEDWGYQEACVQLLSALTTYKAGSVRNWGPQFKKAPRVITRICTLAHLLNEQQVRAREWSDIQEAWKDKEGGAD